MKVPSAMTAAARTSGVGSVSRDSSLSGALSLVAVPRASSCPSQHVARQITSHCLDQSCQRNSEKFSQYSEKTPTMHKVFIVKNLCIETFCIKQMSSLEIATAFCNSAILTFNLVIKDPYSYR